MRPGSWAVTPGTRETSSLIALALIACMFAVIYKTLPEAPLSWSDVWIGAAFNGRAVQPREICDRLVSGQQRCGIELRRRRVADRVAAMVYYSAQISFWGQSSRANMLLGLAACIMTGRARRKRSAAPRARGRSKPLRQKMHSLQRPHSLHLLARLC